MSSPYTVTSLVRCRVKDFASCFFACRFPSEEEHEKYGAASPQESRRKMKKMNVDNGTSVQISSSSRSENKSKKRHAQRDGEYPKHWPRFSEEDYIVFCFREDGAIHMIDGEDNLSEGFDETDNSNTRVQKDTTSSSATLNPINPKVAYSERVGESWDSRGGVINNQIEQEEIPIPDATDDENGINEMDRWLPDEIKETNSIDDPNTQRTDSFESCDSKVSDTSSTSFAFPVLGIEWMGSPVQMPRSERLKPKSILHCCRF